MLLFTSIWDEPFGRVLVEAMAAGLVVIGTGTGGSAEIMTEANSLRFAPEDADGLAGQIYRAYSDPNLYMTLATAGQQHVLEQFNSARFVNGIEAFLTSLVNPLPIS